MKYKTKRFDIFLSLTFNYQENIQNMKMNKRKFKQTNQQLSFTSDMMWQQGNKDKYGFVIITMGNHNMSL